MTEYVKNMKESLLAWFLSPAWQEKGIDGRIGVRRVAKMRKLWLGNGKFLCGGFQKRRENNGN